MDSSGAPRRTHDRHGNNFRSSETRIWPAAATVALKQPVAPIWIAASFIAQNGRLDRSVNPFRIYEYIFGDYSVIAVTPGLNIQQWRRGLRLEAREKKIRRNILGAREASADPITLALVHCSHQALIR